ncbi:MAG: branched-chain amino acid ABC transporter permease [Actinomycetota bacterium]|nr:branched-chain amino acid ABC transporter permease [Actinomycetota bacterium]
MSDVPAPAHVVRATTTSRVLGLLGVLLVAWLAFLAASDNPATQTKIVELCVFVVVASMWNLLAGYTGLVSIGQQAFIGLGAYGLIVFGNGYGQDVYFSIVPAALIVLIASVPIALLAFRLRGGYFAIGMWVIAEVVRLLVKQYKDDPIKGGSGTSLDVPTDLYPKAERFQTTAFIALGLAVLAVTVIALLLRSRIGLSLQAVRDNEHGAGGLGVNVYRERFIVFMIAALFTGAAGAVWYLLKIRIQPDTAFGVADWTAPIVVMVVIGGIGTIEGPIIGAALWYLVRDYVTSTDSAIQLSDEWYLIVTGLLAMVVALFFQRGLWGSLQRHFPSLQVFPIQRRLVVDDEVGDHRDRKRST